MPIDAGQGLVHPTYSIGIVVLSFVLALLGSFAALTAAARIPTSGGGRRIQWEITTAVSLGGGAIGAVHFVGMLAYRSGAGMTFDLPATALSIVIAIAMVGAGVHIVSTDPAGRRRLAAAGVLSGLGIAAMHYIGMAAMRMPGAITYDRPVVALSVLVAVAAALGAFWIVFHVGGRLRVLLAVLVMAVAVCGTDYTGMAATRLRLTPMSVPLTTVDPYVLAYMITFVVTVILLFVVLAALGGLSDTELVLFQATPRLAPRPRGERRGPAPADLPVAADRDPDRVIPAGQASALFRRRDDLAAADLVESARRPRARPRVATVAFWPREPVAAGHLPGRDAAAVGVPDQRDAGDLAARWSRRRAVLRDADSGLTGPLDLRFPAEAFPELDPPVADDPSFRPRFLPPDLRRDAGPAADGVGDEPGDDVELPGAPDVHLGVQAAGPPRHRRLRGG